MTSCGITRMIGNSQPLNLTRFSTGSTNHAEHRTPTRPGIDQPNDSGQSYSGHVLSAVRLLEAPQEGVSAFYCTVECFLCRLVTGPHRFQFFVNNTPDLVKAAKTKTLGVGCRCICSHLHAGNLRSRVGFIETFGLGLIGSCQCDRKYPVSWCHFAWISEDDRKLRNAATPL